MADLGDIIDIASAVAEAAGGIDIPGVGGGGSNQEKTRPGPLRGARLEYDIPALGGRLLIKEPIAVWLGLKPVYPEYGTFGEGNEHTKRAGFRFKSYTVLLKPGTSITVPTATAAKQRTGQTGTETRQMGNFSIGVSSNVSVNEFIEFLKASKQKGNINGVISPTLRKYQWGGVMHRA
jgi:hypothetical protein